MRASSTGQGSATATVGCMYPQPSTAEPSRKPSRIAFAVSGFVRTAVLAAAKLKAFVLAGDADLDIFYCLAAAPGSELDRCSIQHIRHMPQVRRVKVSFNGTADSQCGTGWPALSGSYVRMRSKGPSPTGRWSGCDRMCVSTVGMTSEHWRVPFRHARAQAGIGLPFPTQGNSTRRGAQPPSHGTHCGTAAA